MSRKSMAIAQCGIKAYSGFLEPPNVLARCFLSRFPAFFPAVYCRLLLCCGPSCWSVFCKNISWKSSSSCLWYSSVREWLRAWPDLIHKQMWRSDMCKVQILVRNWWGVLAGSQFSRLRTRSVKNTIRATWIECHCGDWECILLAGEYSWCSSVLVQEKPEHFFRSTCGHVVKAWSSSDGQMVNSEEFLLKILTIPLLFSSDTADLQ